MVSLSLKYGFNILVLVFFCFVSALQSQGQTQQKNLLVSNKSGCSSYIIISGESNVNQFELIWSDTYIKNIEEEKYYFDTSYYRISIPVKDFKADNSFMYYDFLELLKASDYPQIIISIPQNQITQLKSGELYYNPKILITIAGVSKLYRIPCVVANCNKNDLLINGIKKINLTDFNIKPPVKLQGLVKVRDEINVDFRLILTFNDSFQNFVLR